MLRAVVDTKMTKSAGEHWVCCVLARLGWGAALTRDGLERTVKFRIDARLCLAGICLFLLASPPAAMAKARLYATGDPALSVAAACVVAVQGPADLVWAGDPEGPASRVGPRRLSARTVCSVWRSRSRLRRAAPLIPAGPARPGWRGATPARCRCSSCRGGMTGSGCPSRTLPTAPARTPRPDPRLTPPPRHRDAARAATTP